MTAGKKPLSPSAFMRKLRPEKYSDTRVRSRYQLDQDAFEYRLQTITNRNETHDFELFCRKLCERTICPNLRPQTGPEGGGDSKVDSETLPVAEEITTLTYVGEPSAGRERWAFAFSAKRKWVEKIRRDVAGIAGTDRGYQRIINVTSQFAPAKARAALEDELTKKYGISVTIHDRSWIVKEVVEGERKDLAHNYLNVGRLIEDQRRLGPQDYSRTQQLEDIEKELADPAAFVGMEWQRATEALVAAKLSRELELPRAETEGRLARAIRFAEAGGIFRQKLEAHYENICTLFWWFDEIAAVNVAYTDFESMALPSADANSLEFLVTLLQLLFNAVFTGALSAEKCELAVRSQRLSRRLEALVSDQERPNNSLEARALLLHLRLNEAMIARDRAAISALWPEFSAVLEMAKAMAESNAMRLVKLIEVSGAIAGNDPRYGALIEEAAVFVAKRASEAEGALILLKRAQQLDFDKHFDMIRLLGRAARRLVKKEYAEQLIEALRRLCSAYRSAGLLWAARASCIFAMATTVVEGEEENQLPIALLQTVKLWAWIALQMRHLPDFIEAVQLFNRIARSLPLSIETQEKVKEDIRELDTALASYILNFTEEEFRIARPLPDILYELGFFGSHTALLYILGYADTLRADNVLGEDDTPESLYKLFTDLASRFVSADPYGPLIVNGTGRQKYRSTILGMQVELEFDGSVNCILMAEGILGAAEAYFATAVEMEIHPHTERLQIELIEDPSVLEPKFLFDQRTMRARLRWPGWAPSVPEHQEAAQRTFLEVAAVTMAATCFVRNAELVIRKLAEDDAVLERIAIISASANSYRRFVGNYVSRLEDRKAIVTSEYPLRWGRPKIHRRKLEHADDTQEQSVPKGAGTGIGKFTDNHRGVAVRSVIDVHSWDQAGWHATAFLGFEPPWPPALALVFKDKQAAEDIFNRWRERFGEVDENDEIYVAIIRGISTQDPYHYKVLVTSRPPDAAKTETGAIWVGISRINLMQPESSANLDTFLSSYEGSGCYFLIPAVMPPGGTLDFLTNLALRKRALIVKMANDVGTSDFERVAVSRRGRG